MSAGTIAEDLLAKLLDAGDKHAAGARARAPALTAMHLKPYRELRSWHQKQECDETFLAARDAGAVTLQRDKLNPKDGLIERIDLGTGSVPGAQHLCGPIVKDHWAAGAAESRVPSDFGRNWTLGWHGKDTRLGPAGRGRLDRCGQDSSGLRCT